MGDSLSTHQLIMKVFVVLCLLGVVYGGFPICSTEWEEKCWDEPRQQCNLVQKPFTTTVYEQECHTAQVPKVESVPEQKCHTRHEEVCDTVYDEECSTRVENNCRTEYTNECDYASKPVQKYKEEQECN